MSSELRRKIQIGLNKGEANNLLAKAIQLGREGKISIKYIDRQQIMASALSLIMDAICVWNAVYIQRCINYIEEKEELVDRALIKHVSPQNYEHITFLGHYDFDQKQSLATNEFRRLKVEKPKI